MTGFNPGDQRDVLQIEVQVTVNWQLIIRSSLLMALVMGLLALSGCGALHSRRMWYPELSGMDKFDTRLYVEPTMTRLQRDALQGEIEQGREAVARFFGEVTASPYIVACLSNECDRRFGSYGQRAAAYGDMAIRLSGRGLSAALVAHEWSHAEVYRRAGGWWNARKIPRWFDEGVAVVVANESLHAEDNWRRIQASGLPVPSLDELQTFEDWGRAVRTYGETDGDRPTNFHVVYTRAGHEVRQFLQCTGPQGVLAVLDGVRAGLPFADAYAHARSRCRP